MNQPHIIGVIFDTHEVLSPEAVEVLQGSELIIHAGDVGKSESRVVTAAGFSRLMGQRWMCGGRLRGTKPLRRGEGPCVEAFGW